jgi:exopolyphosphatase/guanosine-5'-triphosphate,3'-diphosphate pyrophosphatase
VIRAGIDIGTNTILLLVAEVNGAVRAVEDHVRVVRLGQGVDLARAFHPDAMERAMACFRDYAAVLARYPGIEVRALATSGSRDARNSAEFFARVKKETGIAVRVISGEEEARLSFYGALSGESRPARELAVLDIGGGSTEIVGLGARGELERHSFDMGCVRLTERFLASDPPRAEELAALRAFVKSDLAGKKNLLEAMRGKTLVGVAGTATYLASSALGLAAFDPALVHGTRVTRVQVQALGERFAKLTSAGRLGIGGMDRGRADVIVGGGVILDEILGATGIEAYSASVRGLRYGAVLDL